MATDATSTHLTRRLNEGTASSSTRAKAARAEPGLSTAFLFAAVLAVYWATPTRFNTFDAVSYANQIAHLYPRTSDPHWLFHPHHLLFNAAGRALWRLAQAFGYHGGPLIVLQRLNSVLGAAGVALFYCTLRQLMQRSHWLPALMAGGLAVTFGYWVCATDGRVNMPSITLMLAAFLVLCRLLESPTTVRAALAGSLGGAAVLFHESAGLFLLVGLAAVGLAEQPPLQLKGAARRSRALNTAAYLAAWSGTVIAPYLVIAVSGLHVRSVTAFHQWMSSYSELGWWWNFQIDHNVRLDAYALRHAAFVEPPGKQGTFHVSRTTPAALLGLYFATLIGWFLAVYAFCAALPLLWRSHQQRVMIVCVVWIALYAAFFTVWSPGYFVFWVPTLVPISVLLALALAHYRARRGGLIVNWLVGLWIILYAALNVEASILPHLSASASPFQREAQDVHAHTLPGDLVIVAGAGDGAQYEVDIPYFADRDVLSLHSLLTGTERRRQTGSDALAQAQAQIAQTLVSGHAVYALDEIKHNRRTLNALYKKHPEWGDAEMTALFAPYQRTLGWSGSRGTVWRLTPLPRR